MDESGFLLIPTVIHSWAPRGKTPILPTAGRWTKISAVSAISVSPKRRRLGLYIRFYRNRNIRKGEVIAFMRHLLKHIKGHVVLLWDSSPVHRAAPVRDFLESHRRLHAYRFPGYAPELNPDEFIWTQLKRALANSIPKNLAHLRQLLRAPVEKVRNSQRLLRSCILASDLPW